MTGRELVETRGEENDLAREDAQLAHVTGPGLGSTGKANNTYPLQRRGQRSVISHQTSAASGDGTYISSPEVVMLFCKRGAGGLLGVAHDLDGHALGLAVVEAQ